MATPQAVSGTKRGLSARRAPTYNAQPQQLDQAAQIGQQQAAIAATRMPAYNPQAQVQPEAAPIESAVADAPFDQTPYIGMRRGGATARMPRYADPAGTPQDAPLVGNNMNPAAGGINTEGGSTERRRQQSAAANEPELSDYDRATKRYKDLLDAPVEDKNGRTLSGAKLAFAAAGRAAQTGDLGFTVGAGLGGLLAGLFRPKADEEAERPGELAKAKESIGVAEAGEERQRKGEKHASDINKTTAEAEAERARPGIETERLAAQAAENEKNRANSVKVAEIGATSRKDVAGVNNETKIEVAKITTHSREEIAKAGRELQERLAKVNDATKKEIAELQATVARERTAVARTNAQTSQGQLDARRKEMEAKYPGFGKTVTSAYILDKAKELKALPEDIYKEALKQRYTVKD